MLRNFGKVILDYFLCNYPDKCSFKLSVDDYTFSEFANMANLTEEEIIQLIQKKDTFCYNDLEALAIAAYQVKIVGDVESVMSSGRDSYYQKIRDNYSSYLNSDNNSICNGYFSNQINLWQRVHFLFKKYGRILEIPKDHQGSGRYVQYPIKSHEMKNSELLKWADKFINRKLKPQDINISYQNFCSLFFPYNQNESYKRTVYNFYKIWDGRSYAEIFNRRPRTTTQRDLNSVNTKIVLDYLVSKVEFFNQETGYEITSLNDLKNLFYSQSNKVFFVQDEEDDFYSPKKNKIDFGLDFIIICKNEFNIEDSALENRFQQNLGKETLYIYTVKFSKDICSKLGIETGQKPPIELVGGLRKSKNTYYKFALPAIEFSQPIKEMYINSNKVLIDSNRVALSKFKLPCGTTVIRFSDYLPINFTIVDIDSERNKADEIGWEFNGCRYVPSSLKKDGEANKGTIIGFNSTIDFESIEAKSIKTDNKRSFIIHKDYLENRFFNNKRF